MKSRIGNKLTRAQRSVALATTCLLLGLVAVPPTGAQCPERWNALEGISGGSNPVVLAMAQWDPDGAGPLQPALVVGGEFTHAGGTAVNSIATWNGSDWIALGTGTNGAVNALAVLESGDLIAGGAFTTVDGNPASYIARWDGSSWSPLGTGMNNVVNALAVMPNGDLVAGGFFTTADGVSANRVARWNGASWSQLGAGTNNIVWALAVRQNGDLIAGGMFTTAGGSLVNRIARWNGSVWIGMGGANSSVFSLHAMANDDLIAGGQFTLIGNAVASRIARWDGTNWYAYGSGILGSVWATQEMPNGSVVAAGQFVTPASFIAMWDGSMWNTMDSGMDAGVLALLLGENGLLAGGEFTFAGGLPAPCLAHWTPPLHELSGNGRIDLADWALTLPCLSGPNAAYGEGCDCADADFDDDVDLIDAAAFQRSFRP